MSEPASISSGIAARYASAIFELVRETGDFSSLQNDVEALGTALAASPELRVAISSPVYSRDDQAQAIAALAGKMGLSPLVANTLGLMAAKRRLFVLPQLVEALRLRLAAHRGEVTADVTTAKQLTKAQVAALEQTLRDGAGQAVKLNIAVDETLIGGLVVKMGSKMIDTSIRSKLAALQNAMKEVG